MTPTQETRIRFSTGEATIIVRLVDNPTSRDLISLLPLTLEFTDFALAEKISYLPRKLRTDGSPGTKPANGDLTLYAPWGNLAFFYNAHGGFSGDLIPLGHAESGQEHITSLDKGPVTATLVD